MRKKKYKFIVENEEGEIIIGQQGTVTLLSPEGQWEAENDNGRKLKAPTMIEAILKMLKDL